MDVFKFKEMIAGWYIGAFEKTAFKTDLFEVSYKVHKKNEVWPKHTHKIATEINLLISGKMKMCGKELKAWDIFVVHPNEVSDPIFYKDCKIVCIKTPSVLGDKYIIEEKT
jgi:quercetin dioxygenase-like cupin family protein